MHPIKFPDDALRKQLDTLPWLNGQRVQDMGMVDIRSEGEKGNGNPMRFRVGVLVDKSP